MSKFIMQFICILKDIYKVYKDIYKVWFPWLDIAVLTIICLFLWGEHINPYRQYQLITKGLVTTGVISGESGLYANSDAPRMRSFDYTFALNGKMIRSSSNTFIVDEVKEHLNKYPVKAEIAYMVDKPEINWIKSDLPVNVSDFLKRNLIFGTIFIVFSYAIITFLFRLSIRDYRMQKKQRTIISLPIERMN